MASSIDHEQQAPAKAHHNNDSRPLFNLPDLRNVYVQEDLAKLDRAGLRGIQEKLETYIYPQFGGE